MNAENAVHDITVKIGIIMHKLGYDDIDELEKYSECQMAILDIWDILHQYNLDNPDGLKSVEL